VFGKYGKIGRIVGFFGEIGDLGGRNWVFSNFETLGKKRLSNLGF